MPAWLAPAITAAGMGISAAIAKGKDKRQLNQQGKLNEQQIEANSKWLDIQNQKGFEMWQKTGPTGMMGELQKAELNAGLMYGMGGAGGQSMGAEGGGVNAPNAPRGSGRETEDAVGMGMQLALMQAQKENIQADTANKLGDAANKPLVGKNLEASTGSLSQGIENMKVKQEIDEIGVELAGLEAKYMGETLNDRMQKISGEAVQAVQKGIQSVNDTSISNETRLDTIKRLKAEAVGAILKNAQTEADTTLKGQQTAGIKQDITESINRIMINWGELSVRERQLAINQMLGISADDPLNKTAQIVGDAIDNIWYFGRNQTGGTGGNYKKAPF